MGFEAPDDAGAYPRSRGGTDGVVWAEGFAKGLSPLTRGNRGIAEALRLLMGPIPAHAGEPCCSDYPSTV